MVGRAGDMEMVVMGCGCDGEFWRRAGAISLLKRRGEGISNCVWVWPPSCWLLAVGT